MGHFFKTAERDVRRVKTIALGPHARIALVLFCSVISFGTSADPVAEWKAGVFLSTNPAGIQS